MTIDVVIPVYRPDEKFIELLRKLCEQSVPIGQIICINTAEEFWPVSEVEGLPAEVKSHLSVRHISKEEFDHAYSRALGVSLSSAEFVLLMTDDAVPADEHLVEELIKPFSDESVAATYARQLPRENATIAERFSRDFNYPAAGVRKSAADIERLGIKTFFCSNVCAAYRRSYYDECGGFSGPAIFNEDMVMAAALIDSGYTICYVSDARVIHSHSYKNMEQFHRNFDLAVSQKMHPEVFARVSSESEGFKFVFTAFGYFIRHGRPFAIIPFGINSVYKLLGYRMGKRYESLSRDKILRYTMNRGFFEKLWKNGLESNE